MFIQISQVMDKMRHSYIRGIYLEFLVLEIAREVLLEINNPPELLEFELPLQLERLDREEENDDDLVAEVPSVPSAKNLH